MITRQQFIDKLNSNVDYNDALGKLDDAQRESVKSFAEDFVRSFAQVLAPLNARANGDSEFAKQLANELVNV